MSTHPIAMRHECKHSRAAAPETRMLSNLCTSGTLRFMDRQKVLDEQPGGSQGRKQVHAGWQSSSERRRCGLYKHIISAGGTQTRPSPNYLVTQTRRHKYRSAFAQMRVLLWCFACFMWLWARSRVVVVSCCNCAVLCCVVLQLCCVVVLCCCVVLCCVVLCCVVLPS